MNTTRERHGKTRWHQLGLAVILAAAGTSLPLLALDPQTVGLVAWCLALASGLGVLSLAAVLVGG